MSRPVVSVVTPFYNTERYLAQAIESDAAWKQNLERMHRDYVTPRPADPLWADTIILVTPSGSPRQIQAWLASLQSGGSMAGKIAAPLVSGAADATLPSLYAAAAAARFIVVPAPAESIDTDVARAHGRRVSEMARRLKAEMRKPTLNMVMLSKKASATSVR